MLYSTLYHSPIGELTLAANGEALSGLWLAGQKYFGGSYRETFVRQDALPIFKQTALWLNDYFAGKRPPVSALALSPAGSPFRRRVWYLLCQIPHGQVTTYGQLARQLAKQMGRTTFSAQAVGGAVGHNPISIIIPCHRVVGTNGSLTGYAGGLNAKAWLLAHEGVVL